MADDSYNTGYSSYPTPPDYPYTQTNNEKRNSSVGNRASQQFPHEDVFSRRGSAIYTIGSVQTNTIDVSVSLGEQYGDGISAFMTYKIHTTTTLRHFKSPDFTVTRRYKDFLWLHDRLSEHYKASLIPSLPEKSMTEKFNPEFLEFRRRELERFLKRILNHIVLNTSTDLVIFLEAKDKELVDVKTNAVGKTNFAAQMVSLIGNKIANNIIPPPETDFWFSEKKTFVLNLEQQLTNLANALNAIVVRYQEIGSIFGYVADFTENLSEIKSSGFSENLKVVYSNLSLTTRELSPLNLDLSKGIRTNFEDEVRDYLRMLSSLKTLLNYRTEKNAALFDLQQNLKTKQEKIEKTQMAGGLVPNNLLVDCQRLEKQVETEKEKFDLLSNACKEEILLFEAQKSKEIKQAIIALVQVNIDHELMVSDLWKKMLSKMTR